MIDLRDTTFIIPVRIESEDRNFNVDFVLKWLADHLDTNVIIKEESPEPKAMDNLMKEVSRIQVTYSYSESASPVFHRTRLLNEMLALVKTPVVVNYDTDILLKPEDYARARDRVLAGADLVYPYFQGESQKQIGPIGKMHLSRNCNLDTITTAMWRSDCGHAQFFNTNSYREGGMENEDFISYGPEDSERKFRFQRLGYKVEWMDNFVYHIEHARGQNSSASNPHFGVNEDLFRKIMYMKPKELKEYYATRPYLKKYQQ